MKYFSRNYEFISLDNMVEHIQSGKPLPEKAIAITFDDGYRDNYLYAYPILKKYNVPATIFLATGHIDAGELFWWDKVSYVIHHTSIKRLDLDLGSYSLQSQLDKSRASLVITERLTKLPQDKKNSVIKRLLDICQVEIRPALGEKFVLSWSEVKQMDNKGITFAAHSVNHPILTMMPLEQARYEIIQSKNDIEERLGKEVTAFSYPGGDFSGEIAKLVKESGFKCAVSTLPKLYSRKDNLYCLPRVLAPEDSNKFQGAVCGLWGDLPVWIRPVVDKGYR